MKKRLLLTTLVATMVASTLLVGCGGKENDKDSNTTPTTTSTTKVEEGETKDADNSTNVDASTKEEEDETSYVEKYLEEPDWDAKYESKKTFWIGKGKTEDEAEEKAKSAIEQEKLQYDIKKFVFEDMTQKFKNKEVFTPKEDIHIWENKGSISTENFVCDVTNIIPADTDRYIWFRDAYPEFAGFNVDRVEIQLLEEGNPNIVVKLEANSIKYKEFPYQAPMWVTVTLNQNEDGTFFYKNASFGYEFYEYIFNK